MTAKLFLAIAISTLLAAGTAAAQLAPEGDGPIDITGQTAEFQDNFAVWTGAVRVIQGEAILTTERLEAALNDEGDFETITAIGNVRYSNGKEAITGERGVYDSAERTITMTKNVLVTQDKQVMAAGKVIYWIDTGKVRFFPDDGTRIRGVFYTDTEEEKS